MTFLQAELVLDIKNRHGEGILWDQADECVRWTDIEGRAIWSFDPITGDANRTPTKDRVCCFAPRNKGGFIVAYADRVVLTDRDLNEQHHICSFEPENKETRLNDGRTDRQGRLIVGGMNEVSGAATSSVISIDADLQVRTLFDGVACANATCISADGQTLYFADTPTQELCAFDYDPATGSPSNRRLHMSFDDEPGLPDGACIDAEGGVWTAEWEGHRVVRTAPDSRRDYIVELPVWKPTCCAFGGPDLDTLYVTTSRLMSDASALEREPTSGGLFAVKPGVRGVLDTPFYA
ncbi:SMP-30/gluconolactonase/LRE family protein [Dinoroseobacter sp. S124A]|uniref:SMP-30/gluconolactonase/LRE family protein n=1 Tax=Dinoroseobacter sp. S124A TaxID=3415128 RepID=UPI003C7D8367